MGTCRPLPPAPAPLLSLGSAPRQGCHPSRAGARGLEPQPQSRVSGAAAGPQCLLWVPRLTPHPTPRHRPGRGHRRASAAPTFQSAHLRGAPTAVRVTPKHWMDGVRHPQWFSPENKQDLKTQTARSFHAARLWLGLPALVAGHQWADLAVPGEPWRVLLLLPPSAHSGPACGTVGCTSRGHQHRNHLEPRATSGWKHFSDPELRPSRVSGHVLSPMACGPAPSAVSAVSTHRTARPAANPAPSRARSPGPSAPSRPRGAASPTWPCARALWGTLPVADSQLFSRIPSVCSLQ